MYLVEKKTVRNNTRFGTFISFGIGVYYPLSKKVCLMRYIYKFVLFAISYRVC